jgi:GTP-binding protein
VKTSSAEFVVSAVAWQDLPREGIPEIALAGRSNVGKSSLINRLVGQKNLARTSSTPGKTQSINFYRINRSFYLVDLPGYGYAKAGKSASRQWKNLVEKYFRERSGIVLALHLVDARMLPTPLDFVLAGWLDHLEIPHMIVATKADKLSGNEKGVQHRAISAAFRDRSVVLWSAVSGLGCKEIWQRVDEVTHRN